MNDLSKIDDKELVKELNRRKRLKQALAWRRLEKIQGELLIVLSEHQLSDMKWGSVTATLEDEAVDFFESLKEACGGSDIDHIIKAAYSK